MEAQGQGHSACRVLLALGIIGRQKFAKEREAKATPQPCTARTSEGVSVAEGGHSFFMASRASAEDVDLDTNSDSGMCRS